MSERNGPWVSWIVPLLVSAILGLTGLAWSNLSRRVDQIDEQGTRYGFERVAILETKLGVVEMRLAELQAAQERMNQKMDLLLAELIKRTR